MSATRRPPQERRKGCPLAVDKSKIEMRRHVRGHGETYVEALCVTMRRISFDSEQDKEEINIVGHNNTMTHNSSKLDDLGCRRLPSSRCLSGLETCSSNVTRNEGQCGSHSNMSTTIQPILFFIGVILQSFILRKRVLYNSFSSL